MKTLYLCGVGNAEGIRLAIRVQEATQRWDRILLLDDDPAKHGQVRLGLEVVGAFDELAKADPASDEVVNLVTRTCAGRGRARERIAGFGIPFASLVYPGIDLLGVELGEEVTAYQMSSLGAEAHLDPGAVVLVGALVGHGAHIGAGSIIAPLAVINARVTLGKQVYVGSNATILPDLRIGDGATIAANSVVFSDVPAGATALGVPASILSEEAPPLAHTAPAASGPGAAPSAEFEAEIRAVMQEVLGVEKVAAEANFFDLGGTSLKALALCEALRTRLSISLALVDVYRFPTLRSLSQHLGGSTGGEGGLSQAQQRAAMRRARRR
jgi:carbonic anhydrase/acetyltransferase-like protein (isoleucine patch superfamily)/acyl carrier protein